MKLNEGKFFLNKFYFVMTHCIRAIKKTYSIKLNTTKIVNDIFMEQSFFITI